MKIMHDNAALRALNNLNENNVAITPSIYPIKINWTSVILALAIVGLEVGYVFVYRAGWSVSTASVVANIGLACVLLIVGYFLYRENVSINQIVGILVCMFGLVLINL